ncbi:MAG: pyridoxal phosphate-dependent aminotransferase [Elusimicrobiota bacterium]
MTRKIPASGINLFLLIYDLIRDYEKKSGKKAMNLSLGNPDTVPEEAILKLQSRFAADPAFELHTYGEDNDCNGFTEGMVELHAGIRVSEYPTLKAIPIPGIKTAGALIPLACGLHLPDKKRRGAFRVVSNLPAYDVIGTWSDPYLAGKRIVWPLAAAENMKLSLDRLKDALKKAKTERPDLIYVIRPGNPAAVGATSAEWKPIIEFCIERGARLVNDAAYAGLVEGNHDPLASVAKDYPELEWIEMYSVSKSFSDPGARLGALVGSKDFIEDFQLIKGNTESGPVPYVMAAYGEFFKDRAKAKAAMDRLRNMYESRLKYVIPKLKGAGLRPACGTDAGFFTLWKVPKRVLGVDPAEDAKARELPMHELFNRLVITETGIVGVHFAGPMIRGCSEPLIRYAVCTDVLEGKFQSRFEEQLARLKPEY